MKDVYNILIILWMLSYVVRDTSFMFHVTRIIHGTRSKL